MIDTSWFEGLVLGGLMTVIALLLDISRLLSRIATRLDPRTRD
jgi:hypothetical protein